MVESALVKSGENMSPGTLCYKEEDGKFYGIEHLLPPAPPSQQWEISKKQIHDMLHEFIPHNVSMDLADGRYRLATLSEFLIWWEWSLIWTTKRKKNFKDCDALTRKVKGKLVTEGWAALPPFDVWYIHANGGRHSEFCTFLVDDSLIPFGPEADVTKIAVAYLFEPSKRKLYRPCLEYFAPETGRRVYRLNQ